jgi:hypothetical protein
VRRGGSRQARQDAKIAKKKFFFRTIFASASAARRVAQKRSALLRLASWGQLGSFRTICRRARLPLASVAAR